MPKPPSPNKPAASQPATNNQPAILPWGNNHAGRPIRVTRQCIAN